MEDLSRNRFHDFNLASRKAEVAALRRFQAADWLTSIVGPLGLSGEPSEREFISCLRNGLILCKAINKIHPGAISKVVENIPQVNLLAREFQAPSAYQYFENVRNFLVAVEELNLQAFEASDLERDTLESGCVNKIVDCVLALKSHHDGKQMKHGNAFYKHCKSPMAVKSSNRIHSKISSDSCRHLDMSECDKKHHLDCGSQKNEDALAMALADLMFDTKENIDDNLFFSLRNGNLDSVKLCKILTSFMDDKLRSRNSELKPLIKDLVKETNSSAQLKSMPLKDIPVLEESQCLKACLKKGNYNHQHLLENQEKELLDLKALLSRTKHEFGDLQLQFQKDLRDLGNQVQEMSTAALGYHKVMKENRKLYNIVQDLKGSIRVYCRIRPTFNAEIRSVVDYMGEDGSLVILDPLRPYKDGRKYFQFNHVFGPTSTQDEVYKDTQPLIRSVMDGYNVCIFAYGQTGSGKTYTMSGPSSGSTNDLGINYLALNDLFLISGKRKDITYDIHAQMVEIYNEQVRDLLAKDSSITKLEIRSCPSENGFSLPDATMCPVKSTTDVLKLMKLGDVNRVVSSTAMNNQSSRSHSILTIHVHGKYVSGGIIRSCLHLVDLAGSERIDKSEVTGDRLKEAQYINKSLSCLGDVITALAQKSSHIPYRNSKLTLLLQDSLGGPAKTLMLAHLSPEEDSLGETISTLKFAQRVSTVELGATRINKESSEVLRLKEQIVSLKKALASKEGQNDLPNKLMQLKSPGNKPVPMTWRTPPCISENCSTTKNEKGTNLDEMRGLKPPTLPNNEITPVRFRKVFNTDNCSTSKKVSNLEDMKGLKTPTVTPRVRRLSLEGARYAKRENVQIKASDYLQVSLKKQIQDPEIVTKTFEHLSDSSSMIDLKSPRSPISSHQKQAVIMDNRSPIFHIQQLKTPRRQMVTRNEVQNVMQTEMTPMDSRTTNGKGSQFRKSLRSIGKLINASEKKNPHNIAESRSPRKVETNISNVKSPLIANARASRRQSLTGLQVSGTEKRNLQKITERRSPRTEETDISYTKSPLTSNVRAMRRQSITGIQTSGTERSRRSSLGGKPIDYNDSNKAKTMQRWV